MAIATHARPVTVEELAEELRREARGLYDVLMKHCQSRNCLHCKLNDWGVPVIKPGYCVKGAGLRSAYEAAYLAWYPYSPRGASAGLGNLTPAP